MKFNNPTHMTFKKAVESLQETIGKPRSEMTVYTSKSDNFNLTNGKVVVVVVVTISPPVFAAHLRFFFKRCEDYWQTHGTAVVVEILC